MAVISMDMKYWNWGFNSTKFETKSYVMFIIN